MVNFKQIEKKLLADGWYLVSVCGSHYKYKHPAISKPAVVPNHGSKDISIGVVRNLEKVTGLSLRR
jgi:hypothetical protein